MTRTRLTALLPQAAGAASPVGRAGTRTVEHLHENLGAADVRLSADVLAELDALINPATVSGHRYAEQARREVDTEDFAEK